MAIETLIFDFDGTIADTKKMIIECGMQVLTNHKYPIPSPEKIEALRAFDLKEVFYNHLEIKWYDLPKLLNEGWKIFAERHKEIKPYPGMLEVIESLRKDFRLMILSSNKPQLIEDCFKDWNAECPQTYGAPLHSKHLGIERIIYERGLRQQKENVVYIGDETRDFAACQWAGIKMLAVMWGLNNLKAFEKKKSFKPEYAIYTPQELERTIREMGKR